MISVVSLTSIFLRAFVLLIPILAYNLGTPFQNWSAFAAVKTNAYHRNSWAIFWTIQWMNIKWLDDMYPRLYSIWILWLRMKCSYAWGIWYIMMTDERYIYSSWVAVYLSWYFDLWCPPCLYMCMLCSYFYHSPTYLLYSIFCHLCSAAHNPTQ